MTEAMKITLSTQPADARWGEKATYSINNDGITLHLTGNDDLGLIQRAARKIDGLGIKHVSLDGEGWDTDRSWAFWAGYKGPKGTRKIEWANLDEAGQKELESRLNIIDWVRDTINAPAEELGPEQLAQRAVDLLCGVAGDKMSYRITKGEDLREQNYMGIHTVGRGSERPPVLLALDYNPTGDKEAPVFACLVGKGITFDTGGYSLKQSAFMDSMKSDMGGAATITGALAFRHYPRSEQAREAVPVLRGQHGQRQRLQAGRHHSLPQRQKRRSDEHRRRRPSGAGRWPDRRLCAEA
jgi:PepB aminopeptidase